MRLSNYDRATDYDIQNYLVQMLELSDQQVRTLRNSEFPRYTGFIIFKEQPKKAHSLLWRLTAPAYYAFVCFFVFLMPFKWILTGKTDYSGTALASIENRWRSKIGLR